MGSGRVSKFRVFVTQQVVTGFFKDFEAEDEDGAIEKAIAEMTGLIGWIEGDSEPQLEITHVARLQ